MKRLIFIGGTARSGSTLLGLILSNDPKVMSLGEISSLFIPTRIHHFTEIERIKNDSLIWAEILAGGKKNLYPNLIRHFPEIDIFIDSSKDPFWFKYHQIYKENTYSIYNLLIYKTPEELARSYMKRGQKDQWIIKYIRYHRKYFALIDDFTSISYKDLVCNDGYLKKLCDILDLLFFENKYKYWEKSHITFFGSNSVNSLNSQDISKQLKKHERKDITYDGSYNKQMSDYVRKKILEKPVIKVIYEEILKYGLLKEGIDHESKRVGYGNISIKLISTIRFIKSVYKYYFPENYFDNNV